VELPRFRFAKAADEPGAPSEVHRSFLGRLHGVKSPLRQDDSRFQILDLRELSAPSIREWNQSCMPSQVFACSMVRKQRMFSSSCLIIWYMRVVPKTAAFGAAKARREL
jgi:hypothetical protein